MNASFNRPLSHACRIAFPCRMHLFVILARHFSRLSTAGCSHEVTVRGLFMWLAAVDADSMKFPVAKVERRLYSSGEEYAASRRFTRRLAGFVECNRMI